MPYVQIEDMTMFYKTVGEGEPFLMIHGIGSDHLAWENQEEDMSRHFRLILPDLRGHGKTTVPNLGSMIPGSRLADDLAGLLDHLGYDRVHVLGHSMGGIVAQFFVLRHQNRVRKLILVDTSSEIAEETVDVVYSWREAQVEGGDEAYFWTSLRSSYPAEWIENNPDIVQHLKERSGNVNPAGVLAVGLGLAADFKFTKKLSNIHVPTLIIHGEDDRVFNVQLAKIMHENIPQSELKILKGCGHAPTRQMTDKFNKLVIEFLERKQ